MVISWGKPTIQVGKLNGTTGMAGVTEWKTLDTPVEGTTSLATTEGEKTEAKEEGGAVVDSKTSKNTYALSVTLYKKKGVDLPFEDVDGTIAGNYAVLLQPEDPQCEGLIIAKSTVKATTTYAAADGVRVTYTFDALVPDETDKQQVKIAVVELHD